MSGMKVTSGPGGSFPLTIPNGATGLSAAISLGNNRLARIDMPATWVAANLTFQVSADDVTYTNLYDSLGTEYTVIAAASRSILLNLADFLGIRYLKIRSGTASVPVNQTADRALTLGVVGA